MRSILSLCSVLMLALVISGCRPNEADLKAQEEAMAAQTAAKAAEADVYAADTFRSATSAIDDANGKFEQNEHDEATAGYIQAKDLFDRAKAEAETSKNEISMETQTIIDRVMLGISDTRGSLGEAPRGKGADDDLDQLNADLNQAEANASDARSNLDTGKYNDALARARDAETQLSQVQGSIAMALQKITNWQEQNKPWYLRM